MFNIGSQELIIIFFVVLMLFGAKRIPEVSRQLGKGLSDFRKAMRGIEDELKFELDESPKKASARRNANQSALPGQSGGRSGGEMPASPGRDETPVPPTRDATEKAPRLDPPEGTTVRRGEAAAVAEAEGKPEESAGPPSKPDTPSSPSGRP